MVRKPVVLVTGANGEIGHGLIEKMAVEGKKDVLAIDLLPLDETLRSYCHDAFVGNILDSQLSERIVSQYEVVEIYHLAALLSTRAEFTPETAHQVNVEGTLGLLELALEQSSWRGEAVKFLFPSSIAVYGLPDLETKKRAGRVKEHEWIAPTTMYGCNKLYCEALGRYFSRYYRQLASEPDRRIVDFRSIRFPGLISAVTLPSGGTSDFAPEMLHAAAKGEPYACFVREDAQIPFMAMPDAVEAILKLTEAPREKLRHSVYNIGSFALTAGELAGTVRQHYVDADISFEPDLKRQGIVDTWPMDVNDDAAREDWGFAPRYDLDRAFTEYLVPAMRERYAH
jgi:nucleoside-diphosphate-sugar epimerase